MIRVYRYTTTFIFIALCHAIAFGQSKEPAQRATDFLLRVSGELSHPLNLTEMI